MLRAVGFQQYASLCSAPREVEPARRARPRSTPTRTAQLHAWYERAAVRLLPNDELCSETESREKYWQGGLKEQRAPASHGTLQLPWLLERYPLHCTVQCGDGPPLSGHAHRALRSQSTPFRKTWRRLHCASHATLR
eukprot:377125-Pleurochrysis_carterae.AAC.3